MTSRYITNVTKFNTDTLDKINANINAIEKFKTLSKKSKTLSKTSPKKSKTLQSKIKIAKITPLKIQDDRTIVNIANNEIFLEDNNTKSLQRTNKRLNRRNKTYEEIDLVNTDLYKEKNKNILRTELENTVKNTFQKVEDVINNDRKHKLVPNIINSESNFVVITYWWGGDNINYNTQDPCEEFYKERRAENKILRSEGKPLKPMIPIKKKAISYRRMIKEWIANMKDYQCNYLVHEYPEFAKPGGYQLAINAKPIFIKKALEVCGGRSVVYIDGDMFFRKYPYIFDMKNVDYMARGWNIDPRGNDKYLEGNVCYDNFVFETSGGIMFFGYTIGAFKILNKFITLSKKAANHGKADDRIVSLLFNLNAMFPRYNIIQLPIEYLWLNSAYDEFVRRQDRGVIICEHPACLTSEDVAKDKGANSNREPFFYSRLVDNNVDCNSHGGIFYEYIFFQDVGEHMDKAAESYKGYIEYMRNLRSQHIKDYNTKVPPFYVVDMYIKILTKRSTIEKIQQRCKRRSSKPIITKDPNEIIEVIRPQHYGKKMATVAKRNIKQSESDEYLLDISNMAPPDIDIIPRNIISPDTLYSKANKLNDCIIIENSEDYNVIPQILSLLKQNKDILYIPQRLNKKINRDVIDAMIMNRENDIELIAFTKAGNEWNNMDQYYPKMNIDTPFFFSHNSNILYHVIAMCDTIETDFNTILNSSFIFVTRIRCMWLNLNLDESMFRRITNSNTLAFTTRRNRINTYNRLTNKNTKNSRINRTFTNKHTRRNSNIY